MTRFLPLIVVAAVLGLSTADARAQTQSATSSPSSSTEAALSAKELQRLASEAKTPADHAKLSDYYLKSAVRRERDAADYDTLAKSYEAHTGAQRPAKRAGAALVQGAQHCRSLAAFARKAAAEDRALAALHANAATDGGGH